MPREFVYQYNGKVHLRDKRQVVGDTVPIPKPGTIMRRHGTNYRVIDVSVENARQALPRFVIDLMPLDEFRSS
jgi:hypothetical protein